jgi:hypothetical protein
MAVRAQRMALLRAIVDGLTDTELDRPCTRGWIPESSDQSPSVHSSLWMVMNEECEHHRYAVRDLACWKLADEP